MDIDRKFRISAYNPVNNKRYDETNSLLLCAKDKAVPAALFAYKQECERIGANREHVRSVELLYNRVKDFQALAGGGRVPDTLGAEIERCLGGEDAPADLKRPNAAMAMGAGDKAGMDTSLRPNGRNEMYEGCFPGETEKAATERRVKAGGQMKAQSAGEPAPIRVVLASQWVKDNLLCQIADLKKENSALAAAAICPNDRRCNESTEYYHKQASDAHDRLIVANAKILKMMDENRNLLGYSMPPTEAVKALRAELTFAHGVVERERQDSKALQGQIKCQAINIEYVQPRLCEANTEIVDLKGERELLRGELGREADENKRLHGVIDELRHDMRTVQGDNRLLEQQRDQWKRLAEARGVEYHAVAADLELQRSGACDLAGEVEMLEECLKKVKAVAKTQMDRQSAVAALSRQAGIKSAHASYEQCLSTLKVERTERGNDNAMFTAEIMKLEGEIEALKALITTCETAAYGAGNEDAARIAEKWLNSLASTITAKAIRDLVKS